MAGDPIERRLLHGPYHPPKPLPGGFLVCELRGKVKIGAYSDAPISWPLKHRTRSRILCGDLLRAIRCESASAICFHWGVKPTTVTCWRRIVGAERFTEGTSLLLRATARSIATPDRMRRLTKAAQMRARKPASKSLRLRLANIARLRLSRSGHINPKMRLWTAAEEALLGTGPDHLIARKLNRSEPAVKNRRLELGLTTPGTPKPWTKAQTRFLGTASDAEIAERLRRTESAVRFQRQKLKIPAFIGPTKVQHWSKSEIKLLGQKPDTDLARALGRSLDSIRWKRRTLGIPTPQPRLTPWTQLEIKLLSSHSDEEVARESGRTVFAVKAARARYGISNPAPKVRALTPEQLALLGKISDTEAAKRFNCSLEKIIKARQRHRIRLAATQMGAAF